MIDHIPRQLPGDMIIALVGRWWVFCGYQEGWLPSQAPDADLCEHGSVSSEFQHATAGRITSGAFLQ